MSNKTQISDGNAVNIKITIPTGTYFVETRPTGNCKIMTFPTGKYSSEIVSNRKLSIQVHVQREKYE